MAASGPASGAGAGESSTSHAEVVPGPDLPSGVMEVYLVTKSGTSI